MGGPQPMFYGWAPQPTPPQVPMFGHSSQAQPKPWDVESDSGSDSDFQPSQKSRKLSQPPKKLAANPSGTVKRGPGRPRKNEAAEDKAQAEFVTTLPPELSGSDAGAFTTKDECRHCRVYKGSCLLKPCGHALFCKKCVNALRKESLKR
ncbi:uncharacterized protein LOC113214387 [Frankliniella occidentalis]|uniref:Uncharacterized protein LOC113214387 n=1 Tax=Frankliniella occidentalis TaxID=133901 RepID=A0A9C6XU09_FRAOC|nr:uncharacterized protein LOC113214387 [Frankliniella occidentalis]